MSEKPTLLFHINLSDQFYYFSLVFAETPIHVQAKSCQLGQENSGKHKWQWAVAHENPCECSKIVLGGLNAVTPKRSFKLIYSDSFGEFRDQYGLNCIGK